MLGLSAAVGGTWVERVGPRKAMALAAVCWSTGFLVGALGISTKQLWLLYLGYGVIGGIGLGIGYISPVSTLIRWFPDRPGLATGLAIMGFGGGALIASPLSNQLMARYDPAFHPSVPGSVASGHAVAMLFVTFAVLYGLMMSFGVATVRVPRPGWRPAGFDPATVAAKPLVTTANVSAGNAIRTPQFYLLWIVLFCNVTAGIGILEQAAPMSQDFFRSSVGGVSTITAAAAAGFVGLLSLANMAGRFVWSSTSDHVGRRRIYMLYLGGGIVLYAILATLGHQSVAVFVLVACLILSFYGGGFATVPAYLRDLFGTFQVGADPRTAADRLVGRRRGRSADRQRRPGRAGQAGDADRDRLPAGAADHGRPARGRLRGQPADPAGQRALPPPGGCGGGAHRRGCGRRGRGEVMAMSMRARLIVSWTVVGVPLAYGLWETLQKASQLFTG